MLQFLNARKIFITCLLYYSLMIFPSQMRHHSSQQCEDRIFQVKIHKVVMMKIIFQFQQLLSFMVFLHCRISTANQVSTVYYVERFTLYGVRFRFTSQLLTIGMGLESKSGPVNVKKPLGFKKFNV